MILTPHFTAPSRSVSLVLLVVVCIATTCLQQSLAFSTLGNVDSVLGSHSFGRFDPKTGFVDASESRVNVFGEHSTLSYRLKPHTSKLKVVVDPACFSVDCHDRKIILWGKFDHKTQGFRSENCLFSSVTALTSSAEFTGRTFAFSHSRPSLSDVRPGDVLHGSLCNRISGGSSFVITSFGQLSRALAMRGGWPRTK
jgi:hypothetical protein